MDKSGILPDYQNQWIPIMSTAAPKTSKTAERLKNRQVTARRSPRAAAYWARRIACPTEDRGKSAVAVGYSHTTKPILIESSVTSQVIRAEIEQACRTKRATPEDAVGVLADVMHDRDQPGRDRVQAVRVLADVAGYNAPVQVNQTQSSFHIGVLVHQIRDSGVPLGTMIQALQQKRGQPEDKVKVYNG
jgi:hypothetical protein